MATIDNRVVKVDLDNANFQAKVVQTLGSIQQLASGMSKTSEIKLDTVTQGVETMNKAFSVGGIAAIAGVTRLTNSVIDAGDKRSVINWNNSNINRGVNIAIILQYGHGTRNGGWVESRDYINPAIDEVFKGFADALWVEITKP